jgi:hypothetical protein
VHSECSSHLCAKHLVGRLVVLRVEGIQRDANACGNQTGERKISTARSVSERNPTGAVPVVDVSLLDLSVLQRSETKDKRRGCQTDLACVQLTHDEAYWEPAQAHAREVEVSKWIRSRLRESAVIRTVTHLPVSGGVQGNNAGVRRHEVADGTRECPNHSASSKQRRENKIDCSSSMQALASPIALEGLGA